MSRAVRAGLALCAGLISCALLAATPARATTLTVLALDDDAATYTDDVRRSVARVSAASVRSASATTEDVKGAADVGLVCTTTDETCLVKLALFTHVDELVAVRAQPDPSGVQVELVLVDAALGHRTGAVTTVLDNDTAAANALHLAVEELLVPERVLGSVIVGAQPRDTEIDVDDVPRGDASPPLELSLRKGDHTIVARAAGYVTEERTIHVVAGRATHVDFALQRTRTVRKTPHEAPAAEGPAPGSARTVVGIVSAAAGGAALVGGVTAAIVVDTILRTTGTGDARSRQDLLVVERTAAVVGVIGGAVAVGGAALLFLGNDDTDADAP